MRIAMISEHASPLAVLGGEDAGGQNIHVAELSAALVAAGHDVRVYTRRDARRPAGDASAAPDGYEVVHVRPGRPEPVAKDALLPHMQAFGRLARRPVERRGLDARGGARALLDERPGRADRRPADRGCRWCRRTTRSAPSSDATRGPQDTSPARRIGYERELGRSVDRVVAQCQDEVGELVRIGVPRSRITVVPSGVNLEHLRTARPGRRAGPGRGPASSPSAGWSSARASRT